MTPKHVDSSSLAKDKNPCEKWKNKPKNAAIEKRIRKDDSRPFLGEKLGEKFLNVSA